jgi:hypothetical protein
MVAVMPFGFHPTYLVVELVVILLLIAGGAYLVGWFFRKGWDAAGSKTKEP